MRIDDGDAFYHGIIDWELVARTEDQQSTEFPAGTGFPWDASTPWRFEYHIIDGPPPQGRRPPPRVRRRIAACARFFPPLISARATLKNVTLVCTYARPIEARDFRCGSPRLGTAAVGKTYDVGSAARAGRSSGTRPSGEGGVPWLGLRTPEPA